MRLKSYYCIIKTIKILFDVIEFNHCHLDKKYEQQSNRRISNIKIFFREIVFLQIFFKFGYYVKIL